MLETKANTVGTEDPACGQKPAPLPTRVSVSSRIADWFLTPALAPMVQHRWALIALVGLAILQMGLTAAGLRGWQCPMYAGFGVPCPGCGLSTAMTLFIQGKWYAAIYTHAFAPILLAAVILLATAALMPRRLQANFSLRVAALERRTGIVAILLLVMFIYWGLRLSGVLGSFT